MPPLDSNQSLQLLRRGLFLEYTTLAWNIVGAGILLTAAIHSRSVALAGFGLDSLVEIIASLVVIWQLKDIHDRREACALRVISIAFLALAGCILTQAIHSLLVQAHPRNSPWGIAWLVLTFAAMLLLAAAKRRTGLQLGNNVLTTEARVTFVDACLAAATLLGVALNATFGWWWADPVAGLVLVCYSLVEARHTWHEAGIVT